MGWIVKPSHKKIDVLENIPDIKPSYVGKKKIQTPLLPKDDELTLIDGITPKVQKLLQTKGITTFQDIVDEDVAGLEALLLNAGTGYDTISPIAWPDQARLALHHKWSELEEYQEILRSAKHAEKDPS